jgi:hypothetical protein
MNVLYIRKIKTKWRKEFLLELLELSFVALQCGGLVFCVSYLKETMRSFW